MPTCPQCPLPRLQSVSCKDCDGYITAKCSNEKFCNTSETKSRTNLTVEWGIATKDDVSSRRSSVSGAVTRHLHF